MIFFHVDKHLNDYNQKNLKKLQALLDIDEKYIGITGTTLFIDDEIIKTKLKRGAGAKRKQTLIDDEFIGPTPVLLYEIEKMQKTMTDKEIYTKLGISKATFYRRLKKAKAKAEEENDNEKVIEF